MSISRRVEKELSVLFRSTLWKESESAGPHNRLYRRRAYWSFEVALLGQRRKQTMLEMRDPIATMMRTWRMACD